MFSIVITEKGGAQRQLDFDAAEINIGRLEDNDICLPKSNVSKHHARLMLKDDRYVLVDHKSTNGTYVNGRRIAGNAVVRKGDKIYIGDFILTMLTPDSVVEPVGSRIVRESPPTAAGLGSLAPPPSAAGGLSLPPVPQAGAFNSSQPPRSPSLSRAPSRTPIPYIPPPVPPSDGHDGNGSAARGSLSPSSPIRAVPSLAEGAASDSPRPPPPPPEALRVVPSLPPLGTQNTTSLVPREVALSPRETIAAPPPREAVANASLPPREGLTAFSAAPRDASAGASTPPRESTLRHSPSKSAPPWGDAQHAAQHGLTSPAALAPSVRLQGALSLLMERLSSELDVTHPKEQAFPSEHKPVLERLIGELADEGVIGPDLDKRFLREAAVSEAVGLGPLDRLLANRSVREVVVDGPARILADLGGGLTPVSSFFSGAEAVLIVARRLMHRAGQKLDLAMPIQEGQLPGGGLLQLLLPPLSPKGPLITLRCPPRAQSSAESMVTDGMLSNEMLSLLRTAMQSRQNILVLGPLGSGVSTLLATLAALAADHERIVTIEDTPSVSLMHAQALPLSRRAAVGLSLADLLKNASRLRYDRLVIDDVSGPDSLAALTTAASGTGVLLGMHAPGPSAALTQLELFAQAALGGTRSSLASLVASAIQVLVHVSPNKDGSRRVQSISEVRGAHDDTVDVRMLYRNESGSFRATEHRASFLTA